LVCARRYAAEVLEFSTFWPSSDGSYAPSQLLGEQDSADTYADSTMASCWQFMNGDDETCGVSITTGVGGDTDNNFNSFDPVDGITRKEVGSDCWNGLAVHAAEGYSEVSRQHYNLTSTRTNSLITRSSSP
jgi:hypothetical protein